MLNQQELHLLRQGLHLSGGVSYCTVYSARTSALASGVLRNYFTDAFRGRRPIENDLGRHR